MRFASVAWVATFTTQGLLWLDLLILPAYISAAELAIYSVATSVVVLATFAMSPISQSLAPRIADLTRRKELRRLAIAYQAAASWMLRFSLPFFAIILIFPRPLLGLFGTGYGAGAAVTVILALGKLSDVATGPCGTMLNQAGLNKLALIDNVVILILNVSLNLILIPSHGIHGAADRVDRLAARRQRRPGHPGPPARRYAQTRAAEEHPPAILAYAGALRAARPRQRAPGGAARHPDVERVDRGPRDVDDDLARAGEPARGRPGARAARRRRAAAWRARR